MITESLLESISRGRQGKSQGHSMGLPKLESIIDGVCKEHYLLVGAESGVGKTSFVLYSCLYRPIMENIDNNDFRATIFSLEMNASLLLAKLLVTYMFETYGIRVSLKQLLSISKDYILNDHYYDIVQKCIPWLKRVESMLTIYDKNITPEDLETYLYRELKRTGHFEESDTRIVYKPNNPDQTHLVVLDHLARIQPSPGETLKQSMDKASKILYRYKNRCALSVVVIQQLNRGIQSMDRRKESMVIPLTSDFKDTNGTIEDAETVIAIFSPHKSNLTTHNKYNISELEDKYRAIYVLKSRFGESSVVDSIYYDGMCNVWKEMPTVNEIITYDIFKDPLWYTKPLEKPVYNHQEEKQTFEFMF